MKPRKKKRLESSSIFWDVTQCRWFRTDLHSIIAQKTEAFSSTAAEAYVLTNCLGNLVIKGKIHFTEIWHEWGRPFHPWFFFFAT
jgi:hypothetical protein